MRSGFERWLSLWVALCIIAGIGLGRLAPGVATTLDGWTLDVGGAPVVSIPIAGCLFFMMYPIMVKIDFAAVLRAGRSVRPVLLTLVLNWGIKPFTMYAIAALFLGVIFRAAIGVEATDLVKLPFGLDLPVGATHGAGTVVVVEGVRMLEIPLWRSYLAGCILLGIAPCTARSAFALAEHAIGDLRGCEAVVIGSSVIVGRPVAQLLLDAGATVQVCHIDTRDVAAHSRADRDAPFVREADEAVEVGPAEAERSYLDPHRVVGAAWRTGATLLHPGYGFLAECPALREACDAHGVGFVGPSAEVLGAVGDKIAARKAVFSSRAANRRW